MNSSRTFHWVVAMCMASFGIAQTPVEGIEQRFQIEGQDTVLSGKLPTAFVTGKWNPKSKREQQKYDRLTRNVVKVYPYAKISAGLLREYAHEVSAIEKETDQDVYKRQLLLRKKIYIQAATLATFGVRPLCGERNMLFGIVEDLAHAVCADAQGIPRLEREQAGVQRR